MSEKVLARIDRLRETILDNPFIQHIPTPQQARFLTISAEQSGTKIMEALYGGAAGGGKSDALLMAGLQYANVPGHAAIIFRRTYSDLALPGALMDRAHEWLGGSAARWIDQTKTWTFPSGATLSFGYLDGPNDHYRYQGIEVQDVIMDELTQIREGQYRYLFSRIRRLAGANTPLRMLSASNPGGIGHDWVAQRFGLGEYEGDRPRGRFFIPARLDDNPYLDRESYTESLGYLDSVTRERLLNGDWSARDRGETFLRENFIIVQKAPPNLKPLRFWDRAATAPRSGANPDWTAGALVAIDGSGMIYILDMQRFRGTPRQNEERIKQTAAMDGVETPIRMEQEPGSSGVDVIDHYRRLLMGYDFRGVRSTGSKIERAMLWAGHVEARAVSLVSGPWIPAFLDEAEAFPSGAHDDQIDAVSGAMSQLTKPKAGVVFV